MSEVYVSSEIGRLRRVLVHAPDEGIARISPRQSDELLFDDIVHLPHMREEHAIFRRVLHAFAGDENVLEVEDLIREALENSEEGKEELINLVAEFEELPKVFREEMGALPDDQLSRVLISGYMGSTDTYLFDPIPNFIFTRDIAVTVNDHVIITKAAKEARHRENLLTRFIFWHHPMFGSLREGDRLINLNVIDKFPPSRKGERISVEGGDMMVLNENYLLIGCSERSTEYAFHSVKNALFNRQVIENVVMVKIPTDRSYMHIDTIFTQIGTSHVLAFKPIVIDGLSSNVEVYGRQGTTRRYPTIREFILSEINAHTDFVESGRGKSPYQEREQWTDACNLLAVRPGVALAYDRNVQTEMSLKDHGFSILPAREFLQSFEEDQTFADRLENTIITLPSSELSRARGGSHCMSCPILRDKI